MNTPRTLREAINLTLQKGKQKKSMEELAEELDVSPGLIYRWTYEEGTSSFADLPLKRLKAFMESANCLSILDYLDAKFNRIAFSIPVYSASKLEQSEMVDDYQIATINAVASLRKFLTNPGKKNYDAVDSALLEVMKKSARVKKYCEKKASGQFEMELK